jgi:hypothetical protein
MSDIVERLRNTPNWMCEAFGSWKSAMLSYDRTPFEAADEIEKLRAALQTARRDALEEAARAAKTAGERHQEIARRIGFEPTIDGAIEHACADIRALKGEGDE